MKETFYFSHDSNAREDPKIVAMRSVYGWEGYGWYWLLIEMMRDQQDYCLDLSGKYVFNAFALQMHCTEEKAKQFITDCIEGFDLFESDGDSFWSNSLIRRMEKKEEKSQKARQSANARWNKKSDANAMQTQCDTNAIKENKVKESKVNTTTPISPPKNNSSPDGFDTDSLESCGGEVFKAFESEFGRPLSSMEYQKIAEWLDKFSNELVLHALKIAIMGNNRSLRYIDGILTKWQGSGVKCIQDVEQLDKQHEEQQKKKAAAVGNDRASPAAEYRLYVPPEDLERLQAAE